MPGTIELVFLYSFWPVEIIAATNGELHVILRVDVGLSDDGGVPDVLLQRYRKDPAKRRLAWADKRKIKLLEFRRSGHLARAITDAAIKACLLLAVSR